MKTKLTAVAFVLASSLIAGNAAFAEVTRAEVKAELAEAIRSGDIMANKVGLKLNELYPGRYATEPETSNVTRAEVKAELAQAIRSGDIMANEVSLKLNELYPNRYSSN